ncbi:hypothetical protein FHR55_004231 [Xanthomonas arboricola]
MAIFGIGAYYDRDVSGEFVAAGIAGLAGRRRKHPSYINSFSR